MRKILILDICIIIILISITILAALIVLKPQITGNAMQAVGGQVTTINFMQRMDIWQGFYGNLLDTSQTDSVRFSGSNTGVIYNDLTLLKCYNTEIYATTLEEISWNAIEPATPKDINDFIGEIPDPGFSANQIFTKTHLFDINGKETILYAQKTNSKEGDYYIGLLKQNQIPIFVTTIKSGKAFDGVGIDYQMILPGRLNEEINYNFFLDPADDCEVIKMNPIPSYKVEEGYKIKLEIDYKDIRGEMPEENITYTIKYGAPFDENGEWTPGPTDSGVYIVDVELCDSNGLCSIQIFTVVVENKIVCGDNFCDAVETCTTCEIDCGVCELPVEDREKTFIDDAFEAKVIKSLLILESPDFPEGFLSYDERVQKRDNLKHVLYTLWDLNEEKQAYYNEHKENFSDYYYYVDLEGLREQYRRNIINVPENATLKNRTEVNITALLLPSLNHSLEKKVYEKKTFTEEEKTALADIYLEYQDIKATESISSFQVRYLDATVANITLFSVNLEAINTVYDADVFITLPQGDIVDIFPKGFRLYENNIIGFNDIDLIEGKPFELKVRYNDSLSKKQKTTVLSVVTDIDVEKLKEPFLETPVELNFFEQYPLPFIAAIGLLVITLSLLVKMRIAEHQLHSLRYTK
jgi:hypothetical protein